MKLSVKKKNWPVYELQELLLFNRFDFEFAFGPEKLPGLSRNGRLIIFNPLTPDMYTQILYTDLRTFSWRITWENLLKDPSILPWWSFINSPNLSLIIMYLYYIGKIAVGHS